MHPKQVENLLKLSNEERVEYFIRYCAEWEEVWGLAINNSKWIIFKDIEGDEIFPLWPHKDLAEACAFDEHKEMKAKPCSISVYSFLEDFLNDPDLKNVRYGIFFNMNREALVLTGEILKEELEAELETHE